MFHIRNFDVSLLNRIWNCVSTVAVKSLTISLRPAWELSDENLQSFLKSCGDHFLTLDVKGSLGITDSTLVFISQQNPSLRIQHLNFSGCNGVTGTHNI